jgi:hypothetical protein
MLIFKFISSLKMSSDSVPLLSEELKELKELKEVTELKECEDIRTMGDKTPIVPVAVIPNQIIQPVVVQPSIIPKASGKDVRTVDIGITTNGGMKLNNINCNCLCCRINCKCKRRCCKKKCGKEKGCCNFKTVTCSLSTIIAISFVCLFIFICIYMSASCEYFNLGSIGEYIIGAKTALVCFM